MFIVHVHTADGKVWDIKAPLMGTANAWRNRYLSSGFSINDNTDCLITKLPKGTKSIAYNAYNTQAVIIEEVPDKVAGKANKADEIEDIL